MARKHPKNFTYDEIEDLINKYREEAFLLTTDGLSDALQKIREKGIGYCLAKNLAKGYYMWLKEKTFQQVHEQKVKAETRHRKIDLILREE